MKIFWCDSSEVGCAGLIHDPVMAVAVNTKLRIGQITRSGGNLWSAGCARAEKQRAPRDKLAVIRRRGVG